MNFDEFETTEKFDLIFIDAIHEYEPVKQDIQHALTMLAKGGILAGHDYMAAWPGVIKAVDELIPEREVRYSIWFTQR